MEKDHEKKENVLVVIGKGIEVTQPIRDYIEGKIDKIEKLTPHIIDLHIRIEVQKLDHRIDVVMKFSHFKVKVDATCEHMYAAIDKVFSRLDGKLRKWKERIQDHHAKGVSVTEMEINVLESMEAQERENDAEIIQANNEALAEKYTLPRVLKKKKRPLKMLTLDEAVMKMELSRDHFLVYRSEEEQVLKILYRRRDDSYGILSPE